MAQVQLPPREPKPSMARLITNAAVKSHPRSRLELDTRLPVNGCFEADRVLMSGYIQKRTSKTKIWKPIYLVLRPNRLSMYKSDKEDKLRHQVYLSDLTAVAFLKDPKHKRQHVFGLFSPSKNFHFQGSSQQETESWVNLIRSQARIEEEEEEMFLASPLTRRQPPRGLTAMLEASEGVLSSSPEPLEAQLPSFAPRGRRKSSQIESSGLSGNELASYSDFSDMEAYRVPGTSIESLTLNTPPFGPNQVYKPAQQGAISRSMSQMSVPNIEQDPDRVIWHGWLFYLRTKGGVRQWKHLWGVLRPRNLILYKDESEYTAQHIIRLNVIVNVVDIDPLSKSKTNCLQIITEEKSYRFCTHDEESLVQCIGAFKSLLAKRRELEARAAASSQEKPR